MDKKIYFLMTESDTFFLKYRYLYLVRELLSSFKVTLLMNKNPSIYDILKKHQFSKLRNLTLLEVAEQVKTIPISERSKYLEMVKNLIEDIKIPDTELELWKLLVLDDLAGSIVQKYHELPIFEETLKCIVAPLQDANKSQGFGGYYQFQLYKTAKEKGIPVIGVELQKLSQYYYYHYYFYDYYIVKSEKSKNILQKKLQIPENRILVLKDKYTHILSDTDSFPNNILKTFEDLETYADEIYSGIPVITIVHNLSERYAFRRVLRALSKIKEKFIPLVISHPHNSVLFLKEKEVLERAYIDELPKLKTKGFLLLDTPRHSLEFFTLFSDYIIYVEPSEINNYSCLSENVLFFNPFMKYEKIERCFSNEALLAKFLEARLKSQKNKYTFRSAVEFFCGEKK